MRCIFCNPEEWRCVKLGSLRVMLDILPLGDPHLLIFSDTHAQTLIDLYSKNRTECKKIFEIIKKIANILKDKEIFVFEHGELSKTQEHFHIHVVCPYRNIDYPFTDKYMHLEDITAEILKLEGTDYFWVCKIMNNSIFFNTKKEIKERQFFRRYLGQRQGIKWNYHKHKDLEEVKKQLKYLEMINHAIQN